MNENTQPLITWSDVVGAAITAPDGANASASIASVLRSTCSRYGRSAGPSWDASDAPVRPLERSPSVGDDETQPREHLRRLFPGAEPVKATGLAPDSGSADGIVKVAGYGQPVRLVLAERDGSRRELV